MHRAGNGVRRKPLDDRDRICSRRNPLDLNGSHDFADE
jgi:hypothetical protein